MAIMENVQVKNADQDFFPEENEVFADPCCPQRGSSNETETLWCTLVLINIRLFLSICKNVEHNQNQSCTIKSKLPSLVP